MTWLYSHPYQALSYLVLGLIILGNVLLRLFRRFGWTKAAQIVAVVFPFIVKGVHFVEDSIADPVKFGRIKTFAGILATVAERGDNAFAKEAAAGLRDALGQVKPEADGPKKPPVSLVTMLLVLCCLALPACGADGFDPKTAAALQTLALEGPPTADGCEKGQIDACDTKPEAERAACKAEREAVWVPIKEALTTLRAVYCFLHGCAP